ncbi:hypothetical protein CEE45_12040 [Candidatus Heimdallarchaeota archaeon B3_Heim]|nr:MAG: hypothetical protein CEE45_12040 [Candidatus Heimdallarchaeota archaeon B3_Heim]
MMRIFDLLPIFKEATRNLLTKSVTVQFPLEHIIVPDGFRGAPEVNPTLCIVCKNCEKECPTQCISIVPANPSKIHNFSKNQGKPFWFSINLSQCMFCQVCEEFCPINRKGQSAIVLNPNRWRMAEYNLEDTIEKKLVYRKPKRKPIQIKEVNSNGID